jgi:predicted MFS family arabinose efflux permease
VAAAVVVLAAFAWIERHVAAPLLPAAAAGHPRLRAAAAVSFLNTATTTSAMTLVTLHLQHAAGVSPSAAGLRLLPFSVGVVAGSTLSAPALDRRTLPAVIALGLGTIAAGDAALLLTSADGWAQPAGVAVAGVGIGLSSVAATTLGTGVAATLQGTASGLLNTAAQLGSALGVAALLLIAALV